MDIMVSLLFAIAGLVVIIYLLITILSGVFPALRSLAFISTKIDFKTYFLYGNLRSKKVALAKVAQYFENKDFLRARKALQNTFLFDYKPVDTKCVEQVSDHHFAVLQCLILEADKRAVTVRNIAELEVLFRERGTLHKMMLESGNSLKKASRNKGSAEWAVKEISKKIGEIGKELEDNKGQLKKELSSVFDQLDDKKPPKGVTYH